MDIFGNVFVRNFAKSMMSKEQFESAVNLSKAIESGEIDKEKLKRVSNKLQNLTPKEINKLLDVIDKAI